VRVFFKLVLATRLTIEFLRTILLTAGLDAAAITIHAFHHLIICSMKVRKNAPVESGTTFLKVHEQECPSSENPGAFLLIDYQQLREKGTLHLIVWCTTNICHTKPHSPERLQNKFPKTDISEHYSIIYIQCSCTTTCEEMTAYFY